MSPRSTTAILFLFFSSLTSVRVATAQEAVVTGGASGIGLEIVGICEISEAGITDPTDDALDVLDERRGAHFATEFDVFERPGGRGGRDRAHVGVGAGQVDRAGDAQDGGLSSHDCDGLRRSDGLD